MLIVDKLAFQEKLSEGEKTLAAYILAHGMEIAKYSTRSLAEVTYTSPPTVLRLCKKLGFTGFDDFKQNFVRELEYLDQQQGKVDFNFPFAENDSPMRVAQNIGELYEEAVKDTMQLLRYEDLHKAVLLLKYHEEIHIFSAGTAINQAESFREKMLKIGKRVVIFNNLNYQRYQACCLSERDLAMIISYSGETAQMLEIARQCKRSGTPILALTSFGENSLTCYADCKLTLSTKESIYQNLGDYASHLSMTLLLDILYSEYFRQNYQKNYTYKLEPVFSILRGKMRFFCPFTAAAAPWDNGFSPARRTPCRRPAASRPPSRSTIRQQRCGLPPHGRKDTPRSAGHQG